MNGSDVVWVVVSPRPSHPLGILMVRNNVVVDESNVVPLNVTRIPNSNNPTIAPQTDLPVGKYLLITDAAKRAPRL